MRRILVALTVMVWYGSLTTWPVPPSAIPSALWPWADVWISFVSDLPWPVALAMALINAGLVAAEYEGDEVMCLCGDSACRSCGAIQGTRYACPDCEDAGEVESIDYPGWTQPCPCQRDEKQGPQQYP